MGNPEAHAGQARFGRYELITRIGSGGMAEVHLAVQRGPAGFEKLVVIKLIHRHLASQQDFVDMLLDEGRLAGMIKHPNVVDIYDLGEVDGRYFVAMEYLDGEPLLAILRAGAEATRLDPLSTTRVIADTAEGLEAAHRLKSRDGKPLGLVHHDVSLGNIVVLYSGVVKLVDFGVAKARSTHKDDDRIQGKLGYMAPEKLTEGAEVDRRSDIWSLGVVAWEALTLTRLFKGDTDADTLQQVREHPVLPPSQVNGDVPPELDPIVMRALARDPADRYSTAKAFALDLEDVLRKAGYGGKNELIARYMEQTFARQIAARERLLRDLTTGSASPEVIDAFREAATQTISSTGDGVVRASELAGAPVDVVAARRGDPTWSSSKRAGSLRELQQWVDDRRRGPRWRRYLLPGLAVLVVVVIVAIAARGGDDGDDAPAAPSGVAAGGSPAAPPADAPAFALDAALDAALAPVAVDAAITDPPDASPGDLFGTIELEPTEPTEATDADEPGPRAKPRPKTRPQDLYKRGLAAYRRRDLRAAAKLFGDATRRFPGYAPGWYGLGMVHEARRNIGGAKSAYLRYLSLAPRAANAAALRAHLSRL